MTSETLINFIKISYTIMNFESSFLFNKNWFLSSWPKFPLWPEVVATSSLWLWGLGTLRHLHSIDLFSGCLSLVPSSLKVLFWTFTLSSLLIIYKPGHLLIEKGLGQTSSVEKSLWSQIAIMIYLKEIQKISKGWVGYEGRMNWKENRFFLIS